MAPAKYVVDAIASVVDTPTVLGVTAEGARRIADWVSDLVQDALPGSGRATKSARTRAARKAKKGRGATRVRATTSKRSKPTARAKPATRAKKKSGTKTSKKSRLPARASK
jgi:hypothetical protein